MLYEFIATLSAGFALAGIALIIRHLAKLLFKIQTPRWLTPLFAAIGIFAFQIHQEYHWFSQTSEQLPTGTKVVKTVETSTWYRPWTYIKPYTVRFIAVDTANMATNTQDPNLHRVDLYLFERRMSTKQIPQVIDCHNNKRADYIIDQNNIIDKDNVIDKDNNLPQLDELSWVALTADDEILRAVCQK